MVRQLFLSDAVAALHKTAHPWIPLRTIKHAQLQYTDRGRHRLRSNTFTTSAFRHPSNSQFTPLPNSHTPHTFCPHCATRIRGAFDTSQVPKTQASTETRSATYFSPSCRWSFSFRILYSWGGFISRLRLWPHPTSTGKCHCTGWRWCNIARDGEHHELYLELVLGFG